MSFIAALTTPPVWEYPPAELALDVSYHLVYGVAVAAAYQALSS